jgi:hypothetical protein
MAWSSSIEIHYLFFESLQYLFLDIWILSLLCELWVLQIRKFENISQAATRGAKRDDSSDPKGLVISRIWAGKGEEVKGEFRKNAPKQDENEEFAF